MCQAHEQKKKEMAQIKNRSKLQKKLQLSKEEIANLSDALFKTLVFRVFKEIVEYGHKIEEKVKVMQS